MCLMIFKSIHNSLVYTTSLLIEKDVKIFLPVIIFLLFITATLEISLHYLSMS